MTIRTQSVYPSIDASFRDDTQPRGARRDRPWLRRTGLVAVAAVGICLASAADAKAFPAALGAYYDNTRSIENVFYMDFLGNIIRLYLQNGVWHLDLQYVLTRAGFASSFLPGGTMSTFYDGTNGHIFYLGGKTSEFGTVLGHLDEVYGNPPTVSQFNDLSHSVNSNPTFTSTSYISPQQVPECSGNCAIPGVVGAANVSGIWDGTGEHVFYQGADGQVHDTRHLGTWSDSSLGAAFTCHTFPGTQELSAMWDGSVVHAFFASNNGQFDEAYSTNPDASSPTWFFGLQVSASATGISSAKSQLESVLFSSGGSAQSYHFDGSQWDQSNPSVQNFGTPTLGYTMNGLADFHYVGADNHVYEIFSFGSSFDLTSQLGLPNAAGSVLAGFFDGSNAHVLFIGTDGHVYDIEDSSNLVSTDISQAAGATDTSLLAGH